VLWKILKESIVFYEMGSMSEILKLNPLIIEKIKSLHLSEKMQKFLIEILYLELEKSQRGDDRFTAEYQKLVEEYSHD